MKYSIRRTDTADAGIRKIVLYIAQNMEVISSLITKMQVHLSSKQMLQKQEKELFIT